MIPHMTEITKPLTELTKKNTKWQWTYTHEKAFQQIRQSIKEQILGHFDSIKELIIETDASDHTIRGVLMQEDSEGRQRPLGYMSKIMNPVEQNYTISEKEMLAVIQTVKKWRKYLEGSRQKIKIITDHKNLTYFKEARILNRRQARWALEIQDIPYELVYRKGSENTLANALTRRSDQAVLENRKIFLNEVSIEEAKKRNFHSKMNITEVTQDQDIWKYKERQILTTQEEKRNILRNEHDDPGSGYSGFKETLRKINQTYYWDEMRKEVEKYVRECQVCQQERAFKKTGMEYEIERSPEVWKEVSIDHITKLSRSNGKDSILVIKDQNSGMIHLKAVREKEKASEVWQDCWNCVWKLHELPKEIRTDRGTVFMSKW